MILKDSYREDREIYSLFFYAPALLPCTFSCTFSSVQKINNKDTLENIDKSSKMKMDLQFFSSSKDYATIRLPKDEYAHVMSEINTHMTEKERSQKVVTKAIGNHYYTFENNGF